MRMNEFPLAVCLAPNIGQPEGVFGWVSIGTFGGKCCTPRATASLPSLITFNSTEGPRDLAWVKELEVSGKQGTGRFLRK